MQRHRDEVIKDLRGSENSLMKEAADHMEHLISNVGWFLKNLFTLEDDYNNLLEELKEIKVLVENAKEKSESWQKLFHAMADERNVALNRVKDLEHALKFIRKKASSQKIWYAGVAQAALDGEVKAPDGKL